MSQNLGLGPVCNAVAVTPSDSTDLATPNSRGLYVGVTGDVVAIPFGGSSSVTFKALAAGVVHPIAVKRVLATNTTATNILALY